jgi:WD40 repeat protein
VRRNLEAKEGTTGAYLDESETREAEAFLASPDAAILGTSPEMAALVKASRIHINEEKARKARELEDARKLAESEHARAEVRSRLARRAFLFALVACVASAFSIYAWQRANRMRQQADIQASAWYLTAEALRLQKDQLDLSLLLSIEAYRVAGTMDPSTKQSKLTKSRLLAGAKSSLLAGLVSSSHLLRFAHGHSDDAIRSIVSTKDGQLTITGSVDGTVTGWNSLGIPVTQPLKQHTGVVFDLALSRDGRTLASASGDGKILLWDVAAMQKKPLRLNVEEDRADNGVFGIDFSPDGKSIVSASSTGAITLWDVAARKKIDSVPSGHGSRAYRAIFSPAGDLIASCGANNVVKLWKIESGKLVPFKQLAGHLTEDKERRFVGHPEGKEIFDLAFSPDGSILVSAGQEGTVVRWRLTESEPAAEPLHDEKSETAHRRGVYGVAFSSDGKIIASGSQDQTIRFWKAETGEAMNTSFAGYGQAVYSLAFRLEKGNPTGILLAGTATGAFTTWEPTQEQAMLSIQLPFNDWVTRVRYDRTGGKLAVCIREKIFVIDLTTGSREELKGHSKLVRSFALSSDGHTYAAGADDGKLLLWDSAHPGEPTSLETDSSEPIWAVAYTPDSKILLSSGPNDQVLVWDVASGKRLRSLERAGSKRVFGLAVSPDGKTVAVASEDNQVALWNVADWRLRPKLLPHEAVSAGLAFSPDRKTLATSSAKEIILWDVATATPLGPPLRKHDEVVNAVAFSPNGEILASASEDKSIILWNVATQQLLAVVPSRYSTVVRDLAFSPDGRTLAAAGWNTTLWDVNFDSWQCRAAEMAGRNLTREEWSIYLPDEPYMPTFPYGLMLEAHKHAVGGEAGEARRDYADAVKTAARIKDMQLNNAIAWWGTLDGFADVVLPACDVAIREAPLDAKPMALDTRGVGRALTGKLREAADDLEEYIRWAKASHPELEKTREQRERWVGELRKKHNPIDKKTLEALRVED